MVAVFCSPIGSKVRLSASAHFGITFLGLPLRERRLAPRNAVEHVLALARVLVMLELLIGNMGTIPLN